MNEKSTERKARVERKTDVKNGINRMVFTVLVFVAEVVFIIMSFSSIGHFTTWLEEFMRIGALILVLAIYSQEKTSSMKTPWIILILLFPIVGVGLYLITGLNGRTWKMKIRYAEIEKKLLPHLKKGKAGTDTDEAFKRLKEWDDQLANVSSYLINKSGYPVYQNTDIEYYDDSTKALEAQKEALKQAKKFILMEYHAIEDKETWHEVQDILEERVKAGVEVRLFYDDMGSIWFITNDFIKRMQDIGMNCRVFNPLSPGLNMFLNNRDHRKITVIDGEIGFTGGYNLANEYFNVTHPYGQWKDTGVKITGEAVRSMTVTFLENWNAVKSGDTDDLKYDKYILDVDYKAKENCFVQPYADSPLDNEHVGEEVYISMVNKAVDYCWFISPYLIITDEMIHAMGLAAKRGVDVRIITPGIPDKSIVYQVTRSYYHTLTKNGVRIYEWKPGFCHCKMCVSDDIAATCGTINLDYRSLYHHFENGCLYMGCDAVKETKEDFERTFKECEDVTEFYTVGRGQFMRIGQLILRLFAPLM
ncbi:MAG: cardiolipin synthase [Lachnospiraceae bacterium]|nr:cardiolipin synthase [Lachnospiraceae bacterium]